MSEVLSAVSGSVGRRSGDRFAELLAGWRAGGAASPALIMGVVNVTPDSFSDGGRFADVAAAAAQGERLAAEGAAILDIGGESTRAGAQPVAASDELRRVLPVIERLAGTGALLSVDTMKAEVAEAALRAGVHVVNDVRGLLGDPAMADVAARYGAGVVAMHNPGLLGSGVALPGDPVAHCLDYFGRTLAIARRAGIGEDRIVLDPGLGFGKSPEQNFELIARLPELESLGFPILIGASRKSFIGRVTGREVGERLAGSLAAHVAAALGGAAILRVHDVAQHVDAVRVAAALRAAAAPQRRG